MNEPHSTIANIAGGAGASMLAGATLGMQHASLFAGFMGAAIGLSLTPTQGIPRMLSLLFGSTLFATYFSPVLAAWFNEQFVAIAAKAGEESIAGASACALGIGAHVIVPIFLTKLRKWRMTEPVTRDEP